MIGKAYRLYAKSVKGKWILVGSHYQDRSWTDKEVELLTKLGIKTRIDEYETEYDDRG